MGLVQVPSVLDRITEVLPEERPHLRFLGGYHCPVMPRIYLKAAQILDVVPFPRNPRQRSWIWKRMILLTC